MSLAQQIAKHFRDVHFGGNWTTVDLKTTLAGVTWQQATVKVDDLNTIVTLVYHMYYYVNTVLQVLKGGPLTGNDKMSFDHPPINNEQDWNNLLAKFWNEAEQLAALVEQLPDSKFFEDFTDSKYGNYYRNICGITEHTHYHLGQIALLKKMPAIKNAGQ